MCHAGQWECSGEKCEAQCSVIGAMHITTFDQKRYGLQAGDCRFTAVEVSDGATASLGVGDPLKASLWCVCRTLWIKSCRSASVEDRVQEELLDV